MAHWNQLNKSAGIEAPIAENGTTAGSGKANSTQTESHPLGSSGGSSMDSWFKTVAQSLDHQGAGNVQESAPANATTVNESSKETPKEKDPQFSGSVKGSKLDDWFKNLTKTVDHL